MCFLRPLPVLFCPDIGAWRLSPGIHQKSFLCSTPFWGVLPVRTQSVSSRRRAWSWDAECPAFLPARGLLTGCAPCPYWCSLLSSVQVFSSGPGDANGSTVISPYYCTALSFCFANSPFVNNLSWNYSHLQVPSASFWDSDWYRFHSHACVQKENQNKVLWHITVRAASSGSWVKPRELRM